MDTSMSDARTVIDLDSETDVIIESQIVTINPIVLTNGPGRVPPDQYPVQPILLGEANGVDPRSESITTKDSAIDVFRPTGFFYDPDVRFHSTLTTNDAHPEDPRRVEEIYRYLVKAGLVGDSASAGVLDRIYALCATRDEICLVHTQEHYDFVRSTEVYYNRHTYRSAKLAAGGAIGCCVKVMSGAWKNAIAVIRPPGHHAVPSEAQGFCIFNNVSVAARVCQRMFGASCQKILIFDWDVHHGNGTQDTFYRDGDVLFVSVHVHKGGTFYPGRPHGNHTYCGEGRGAGKNVNIAWSEQGMGDAEYMYAFHNVVMPIAREFDPDLVIVSAGFDAAVGDDMGGCFVTPACYAQMTHALMGLAEGRVVVCLEGGYNLRSISNCALAVTRTLAGGPPERLKLKKISKQGMEDVRKTMKSQSVYWDCLSAYRPEEGISERKGQRFDVIIRKHQVRMHWKDSKMITLWTPQIKASGLAEDQVVASAHYRTADKLLFVVHDPPHIVGHPDPDTNGLSGHHTWLIDPLKEYIAWAIAEGYAVIDVNLQKRAVKDDEDNGDPGDDGRDGGASSEEDDGLTERVMNDLVVWVHDNYIFTSQASKLFYIGVGSAYARLMHLVSLGGLSPRLKGIVSFIEHERLEALPREASLETRIWYFKNTLIFAGKLHDAWESDGPPRKKFGKVIESSEASVSAMLAAHQPDVVNWIARRAA
ncbi:MAG: Histone deacetylase hda1 [Phylliscum demangeonii]|nr:MAG: Histone deacetylase hda1 [Phylliscum demangeonii]